MSQTVMYLLVINESVFHFIMAAMSPTVHLYFMRVITNDIYVLATTIGPIVAAVVSTFMVKENVRVIMRKWFAIILAADAIGFLILSVWGMDNPAIRFIGFAILNAITVEIWMITMMDAINQVINGSALTGFQTLKKTGRLWAGVAGGIVAFVLVDRISLELAIYIECVFNVIFAAGDYKLYHKINKVT